MYLRLPLSLRPMLVAIQLHQQEEGESCGLRKEKSVWDAHSYYNESGENAINTITKTRSIEVKSKIYFV